MSYIEHQCTVVGRCVISALAGYSDKEDSGGSGELSSEDDRKEADQHLMMNSAFQKTVYIASTIMVV